MRISNIIIAFILLISSACVYGAQNAKITVDKEGSYYYWFTYSDINGKAVTTTPAPFSDKKTTVELPLVKDAVPKCKLFVLNETTGNEAVLDITPKAGAAVKFDLKASSFDRVRRVEVLVTSIADKAPVAACVVKLGAGKDQQVETLDPSALGVARFEDAHSGTVKVSVEYGEGKTSSQDVDIPLERDDRVPRIEVPVVGQVDTVNAPVSSAKTEEKAKEPVNSFINFPMAVVGMVLFGLILWGAVRMMSNRGAGFRQVMQKVGVDLPGEPEPVGLQAQTAQVAPVDPTVCAFCGGKKDAVTGTCACSLGGAAPSATPSAGSGPRLIATQGAYMGSIFQIDGTMVIGRDESNPIPLPLDTTVSRKHAAITNAGGTVTVADQGSSNGTFVNGVKITEQVLKPGDEVQIGSSRFRFEA